MSNGGGNRAASCDGPARAVVIVSGGLDSITLVYHLLAQGTGVRMLSADYGQRHVRELDCARQVSAALGLEHQVADLRALGPLLAGSALTDPGVSVPDGDYRDESMKVTVVPNRNALLLDVAVAVAVTAGCDAVAFGAHGGDHPVYPDCRPEFVAAFEASARLATAGFAPPGFRVLAPFVAMSKADIVLLGSGYGVPFEHTWSCYNGGARHCGTCGTCTERREAFTLAGLPDPTRYEKE
jgi:7-cyano-7-deazaguanine synthase